MLTLVIPPKSKDAFFNDETQEFVYIGDDFPGMTIQLEHSLISISKWESKWHKPYLSKKEHSEEENLDYIRCMTLTKNVPDIAYESLTKQNIQDILTYINDPMTATTVNIKQKGNSKEIVTSELIYYWMVANQIPFECQKWPLNRLMTLIEVCSIKNSPPKKMSQKELMARNSRLNAARRAKYHSRG